MSADVEMRPRGYWGDLDDADAKSPDSASDSWLHKTNRADADSSTYWPSSTHITLRSGTKLRQEALDSLEDGSVGAITWSELKWEWLDWIEDTESSKLVFEDEEGEFHSGEQTHSYSEKYQRKQCARAHQLEDKLREKWGSTLHTAMLTLTGSHRDSEGRHVPPADHQNDLLASWSSVRRELKRVMNDTGQDWHRLGILEPHPKSGYTHIHIAVFAHGPIQESTLRPVIQAHLRNCDIAGEEAHENAIEVKTTGDRNLQSLGSYLSAYLAPNFGVPPVEREDSVQRWNALQWAMPAQRFRPDNEAQELMEYEPEEEEETTQTGIFTFIGIAPNGDLDDVVEVEPSAKNIWGETQPPPSARRPPPD